MRFETEGPITILYNTGEPLEDFLNQLTQEYPSFDKQHLVVDLTDRSDIRVSELKAFLPLAKAHRKAKKTFVVVIPDVDFNKTPAQLHVVPTRQEAHDLIEMEEIERDLGF
ncbi:MULTISPECIES: ribonuclease Z [unclassified Flavobacterium]|uniref:ribonuclease Z n=1 Tax=unclassified Flavobacterium TaxID=196869 RepID=UPI001F1380FE|nr:MULTISPECIES: ribonuclease Z [unclassified Flavobacterium]UMY65384.1 ribonuclease Z [Flavobacterium sp. HJ-32-4]